MRSDFLASVRNNQVTRVKLARKCRDVQQLCALVDAICASTSIRAVDLTSNHLGDAAAPILARLLTAPVKRLMLGYNDLVTSDEIWHALQQNSALKELNLYFNALGDRGARRLACAIQSHATLKKLNVGSNGLSPLGVKALCQALRVHQTVELLDIGYNDIGNDVGCDAVCELILSNNTLVVLHINNAYIAEAGMRKIADALDFNFTLRVVRFFTGNCSARTATRVNDALCRNRAIYNRELLLGVALAIAPIGLPPYVLEQIACNAFPEIASLPHTHRIRVFCAAYQIQYGKWVKAFQQRGLRRFYATHKHLPMVRARAMVEFVTPETTPRSSLRRCSDSESHSGSSSVSSLRMSDLRLAC